MPELPEVEVLVRQLSPVLRGKVIEKVIVRRARTLRPTRPRTLARLLTGAKFVNLSRRGKYLVFELQPSRSKDSVTVLGHLGMTGRMYLQAKASPLPKHTAVAIELGRECFVFEDTRYFGRFTLETSPLNQLGPELLGDDFTLANFREGLKRSSQPIKVKLLDQSLVAGIGNIYASEALFRAGVSPRISARNLSLQQVERLWAAVRDILVEAISFGSTIPLNHSGSLASRDGLFYYGQVPDSTRSYEERFRVYDRFGQPCYECGNPIHRTVQAARSTFYCAKCQK